MEKFFVREFSKEFSKEERKETAQEVKSKRKLYFSRTDILNQQTEELSKKIENKEMDVSFAHEKLAELDEKLAEAQESKLGKLLDYFGFNKQMTVLRSEIGATKESIEKGEAEYQQFQTLLIELQEERKDRRELQEARKTLSNFYEKQSAEARAFQVEQERIRDVQNVVKDYGVTFVHGIHPNYVPGINSMLREGVDWKTKLAIALAFEPTISSSTIKKGDTARNMWARMGLILNGGFIEGAFRQDAGTQARGIKKRFHHGFSQKKLTEADIQSAVNQSGNRYNEFLVSNWGVAGFYICREEKTGIPDLVSVEEIMAECEKLGLNLYEIKNGVVYKTAYDSKSHELVPTAPVYPDQVLGSEFKIDDKVRNESIEKILGDSPFGVYPSEAQYIDCRANGRELYMLLNLANVEQKRGRMEVFHGSTDEFNGHHEPPRKGEKIDVISEFSRIGYRVKYFTADGKLFRHEVSPWLAPEYSSRGFGRKSKKPPERIRSFGQQEKSRLGSYIHIAFNTHQLNENLISNESYLRGMARSLQKLDEDKGKAIINAKNKGEKNRLGTFYDDWIKRLAWHLHGFSEQASEFGDNRIAGEALALANSIVSVESFKETLSRRIDNDGRLKVTIADLESYS